ncbi:hypothetical protein BGW80DRAFT_915744 [Lactifluus volemus]|nr:hypothetical protein BGW80DRAFT_915744 [Lactifluus volemus]
MLPFIIALVFAVGLPFLPASFHRALHLPTLRFNFLSARHTPSVPTLQTPLAYEGGYFSDHADSDGPLQLLVLPPTSIPNHLDDATATPAYISLTDIPDYYYSRSIWDVIHPQVLYELAEATIIMSMSFFVASTFLPRRCLSTFMERLYTALFIRWLYSPKVAFSSFLQDIFCGIHTYWMDNSVNMGQASISTASTDPPTQAALETLTNTSSGECCEVDAFLPSIPANTAQDNLDLVALGKANLYSEGTPSLPLVTSRLSISSLQTSPTCGCSFISFPHPPHSATEIPEQQRSPDTLSLSLSLFGPRPREAQPTAIIKAINDSFDITEINTSSDSTISPVEAAGTRCSLPITPSLTPHRTPPFLSMSITDLYNSNRLRPNSVPTPPCGRNETVASRMITGSSSVHGRPKDVISTTPIPEPETRPTEGHRNSSRIPHGSRRRYNSDSIQVRNTYCHLGDPAAPLDPARVGVTCAFWENGLARSVEKVESLEGSLLASGLLSGRLADVHIRRNKPEQTEGNLNATLSGIAVTSEGGFVVPASQRSDGSMRKEIKVRPGHFLRGPLVEKYRPPAARARTLTWDPSLHERSTSLPSSPHGCDPPLHFTPKNTLRHRFSLRPGNSPACQSDDWRRPSDSLTGVEILPASENRTLTLPQMVVKPSPQVTGTEKCALSPETSAQSPSLPSQIGVIQSVKHLPSHPSVFGSTEEVTASALPKQGAEASTSSPAVIEGSGNRVEQQPERSGLTTFTSLHAGNEDRSPLRDITIALLPTVVSRFSYPSTMTVSPPTTALQVADVLRKNALRVPNLVNGMIGDTVQEIISPSPLRKRKSSGEPIAAEVPQSSVSPALQRHPRARRSAPHLGKHGDKQQVNVHRSEQTPESTKRRRVRTASAKGVENWNVSSAAPAAVDRNGQIVLPAGTGWKGRSSSAGQPHRQVIA